MTKITCNCGNLIADLNNDEDYIRWRETLTSFEQTIRDRHMQENKNTDNYMMKKIKKAIQKNIVVYDQDAAQGQLTFRLLVLMADLVESSRHIYKNGVLRTVYVPPCGCNDLLLSADKEKDNIHSVRDRYLTFKGIEIVEDFRLDHLESNKESKTVNMKTGETWTNTRRNYFDYFNAIGGELQTYDIGLVIGVCDNGEPILGSY